jgi:Kae1-associated kinase Bud32
MLARGAEAKVFHTTYDGEPALAKRRLPKAYRLAALDNTIRKQRTRREAKILRAARAAGAKCAELLKEDEQNCELLLKEVEGTLLSREKTIAPKQAFEAGLQLALLHDAGIVHGDYTTSNLIADGNLVTVIDFGLGEFSNAAEEKATDVLLFEKSIAGRANEPALRSHFEKAYLLHARNGHATLKRVKAIYARMRYASQSQ